MAIQAHEGVPPRAKPKPPKAHATRQILRRLAPAATTTRPLETRLTAIERELSGDGVDVFVSQIGGRQRLVDLLSLADATGEGDQIIALLLNPEYEHLSLRRLCEKAGITIAHLLAAYKKAAIVAAHIQAIHIIAGKVIPVVEDVMMRAAPIAIPCPECRDHEAKVAACPFCGGTGQMLKDPDIARQRLALELAGLIEKRGIVVNQNTAISAPAATTAAVVQSTGTLEQLHQAVGELLFDPKRRRKASPALAPGSHPPRPQEEDVPLPYTDPHVIDLPREEPADPDGNDDDNEEEDETLTTRRT